MEDMKIKMKSSNQDIKLYSQETIGWIQPTFLLEENGGGGSLWPQKSYTGGDAASMDESYME